MSEGTYKLTIAIIAAVAGLAGTAIGAFLNSQSALSIEGEKLQSKLILNAVSGKDKDEIADTLKFYMELGVIAKKEGFLSKINDFSSKKNQSGVTKNEISVSFETPSNSLLIGDIFKGYISCSANCFLKIYHVNKDLTASLLFPRNKEENFKKKGEFLSLPQFKAILPYGFDMIAVVASPSQFEDLTDQSQITLSDFSAQELRGKGVPKSTVDQSGFAVQVFSTAPAPAPAPPPKLYGRSALYGANTKSCELLLNQGSSVTSFIDLNSDDEEHKDWVDLLHQLRERKLSKDEITAKIRQYIEESCSIDATDDTNYIYDHVNRLMWTKRVVSKPWSKSDRYLHIVNSERIFEYNDWRLPSKDELTRLNKVAKNNPKLVNNSFDWYWSSNDSSFSDRAITVNGGAVPGRNELVLIHDVNQNASVRLVRDFR